MAEALPTQSADAEPEDKATGFPNGKLFLNTS
jgi:hypothetical protein